MYYYMCSQLCYRDQNDSLRRHLTKNLAAYSVSLQLTLKTRKHPVPYYKTHMALVVVKKNV